MAQLKATISTEEEINAMKNTILKYKTMNCENVTGRTKLERVDRYGFQHKHSLKENLLIKEGKEYSYELARNSKWLKMLNDWNNYSGSRKLTNRTYKGVPDSLRGYVWCMMLGVPDLLYENQGLYEKMKSSISRVGNPIYIKQIHLDLPRTFRKHTHFKNVCDVKQHHLFFILATYSTYNLKLGYCQGMNEMAAVFLMYMGEEEAFWALTAFMTGKKNAMHGFMVRGFPKLKRFQHHHDQVLNKFLPKVHKHMTMLELPSFYNLEWFLMAFLRFRFSLVMRIWDAYMLRGDEVLVGMAYTIVKMFRKELLQTKDISALLQFFKKIDKHPDFVAENEDMIMASLQANIEELTKKNMNIPPPPINYTERFKLSPTGIDKHNLPRRRPTMPENLIKVGNMVEHTTRAMASFLPSKDSMKIFSIFGRSSGKTSGDGGASGRGGGGDRSTTSNPSTDFAMSDLK